MSAACALVQPAMVLRMGLFSGRAASLSSIRTPWLLARSRPLRQLAQMHKPFVWDVKCSAAFGTRWLHSSNATRKDQDEKKQEHAEQTPSKQLTLKVWRARDAHRMRACSANSAELCSIQLPRRVTLICATGCWLIVVSSRLTCKRFASCAGQAQGDVAGVRQGHNRCLLGIRCNIVWVLLRRHQDGCRRQRAAAQSIPRSLVLPEPISVAVLRTLAHVARSWGNNEV
jgi:hypothetical protein